MTPAELAAIAARESPYHVECPRCGAGPGVACANGHGDRARTVDAHAARRREAVRAMPQGVARG